MLIATTVTTTTTTTATLTTVPAIVMIAIKDNTLGMNNKPSPLRHPPELALFSNK
jgi:hypothetical protein